MRWVFVLLFGLLLNAHALRVLDTEVGYVDVSDLTIIGDEYRINGSSINVIGTTTKEFTAHNYSISVDPKNLEKIAADMGLPLSGSIEWTAPAGFSQSQSIEVPDIVCGTYRVSGEAYYSINGTEKVFRDVKKLGIPCKDFKSKLISGLVAKLPYSLLKALAGFFGFRMG